MKRQLISGASGLVLLAFAGSSFAATPGPADLKAVGNNLGPTVEALADGLGNTANTLISTQSAVQTSAALGSTLVSTGTALIQGAPNLAQFKLALLVGNLGAQHLLNPYLTAIDNPTGANIKAALAPQDLNTIVKSLQDVPYALIEGQGESYFNPYGNGLRNAGIQFLKGNVSGAAQWTALSTYYASQQLLLNTNYAAVAGYLAVGSIAFLKAGKPVFKQLKDPAHQLADATAPLTAPVLGILKKGF